MYMYIVQMYMYMYMYIYTYQSSLRRDSVMCLQCTYIVHVHIHCMYVIIELFV